ncbi:MmyB family transcriptional regulator [Nocardia sp. NPDC004722]
MPTHLGPGARRLLDRLDTGPVGIFTAAWTQLAANSSWTTLFYDPNAQRGHERNLVWREFIGMNDCVIDPEENNRFRASLVADLRAAATRYPADRDLTKLIADSRSASPCFVQAWDATPPHPVVEWHILEGICPTFPPGCATRHSAGPPVWPVRTARLAACERVR